MRMEARWEVAEVVPVWLHEDGARIVDLAHFAK
jgi:hypothetical protein